MRGVLVTLPALQFMLSQTPKDLEGSINSPELTPTGAFGSAFAVDKYGGAAQLLLLGGNCAHAVMCDIFGESDQNCIYEKVCTH
jgi:hypothetical protein